MQQRLFLLLLLLHPWFPEARPRAAALSSSREEAAATRVAEEEARTRLQASMSASCQSSRAELCWFLCDDLAAELPPFRSPL